MARFDIETNIGDVSDQVSGFASLVGGPLVRAIGLARAAWTALNVTFVASGIGLIITGVAAAIALLTEGLSRFQPLLNFFERTWAALGTGIEVAADNLLKFLGILDGETKSIRAAALAAASLVERRQELFVETTRYITIQARLNAVAREALLLSSDQSLSEQERIDALDAASVAINKNFQIERELLTERIAIEQGLLDLANSTDEQERELAESKAELIALDATQATQLKEITGLRSGLQKAIERQAGATRNLILAETNDELLDFQRRQIETNSALGASARELTMQRVTDAQDNLERLDMEIDALKSADATKEELAAAEMRRDAALGDLKETQHQDNLQRIADDIAAEEAKQNASEAITDAVIGSVGNIGDALTTLAGENKSLAIAGLIVEQAAGVAGIIVDTIRASTAALQPPPVGLGPVAGIPLAAVIGVGGIASVVAAVAATKQGIDQINAAPGPSASGVAGGGGASGIAFGPTVATPATGPMGNAMAPVLSQQAADMQNQPTVLLTPTSGPGSLESSTRANNKRNNRRRL